MFTTNCYFELSTFSGLFSFTLWFRRPKSIYWFIAVKCSQVIPRLHDEAGTTSWLGVCSLLARRLLDVCSIFAWSCKPSIKHCVQVFNVTTLCCSDRCLIVFTRESSYCFQRVLAITILSVRPSVCLSVHPSHGWISQKRCKLKLLNFHPRLPGRL